MARRRKPTRRRQSRGKVAGLLRCASSEGDTRRWKAPRAGDSVPLDGGTATPVLNRKSGTGGVGGSGFERCARPKTPTQRSAAPVRRSSFRASSRESVASLPEAGGAASTEPPPASKTSPAFEMRESSGRSGARAVGRLQRSVRGIFPSLPSSPVRATRAASDSTVRPLP